MKEFLLLIHGENYADESPEMMKEHAKRYFHWMNSLIESDNFVKGHRLSSGGAVVADKETVIYDGPYLEAKEVIGGYIIIRAKSLDKAVQIAKGCPLSDEFPISVRPMYQGSNDHEFPQ